MNKKIQEQVLKDKELRKFIIQFVHYGHGNVGGRLLTKKIKCDGCEEDVNAIIEDISSRTIKLMEEEFDKSIKIASDVVNKDYNKKLEKQKTDFRKMIEGMINFHKMEKEELIKKEADLIEIVPHIDYIVILKELLTKLGDKK